MEFALTAARLRPRVGIDDAIGGVFALAALLLTALIGVHDVRRPVYGPIDEVTHTAFVLAVAQDGIPPFLGRDRAFVGAARLAPRDVRIPPPDKTGSAPVPIGAFHEVAQTEAIQPPFYYYAAAPVTWFVSGRDKVVAIRLFDVMLCMIAVLIVFLAVRDIGGTPLGGGIASLLITSAGGLVDVFSYVTNGSMMFALGAAVLWLTARGIRNQQVSWPLVLVAGAFSITHTIVIPLAALCVLAPAAVQLFARPRGSVREVAVRIGVGAIPLGLWILSNLYRYHWIAPRSRTTGGLGVVTTGPLDFQQFASTYFASLVGSVQEPFHPWTPSPYVYDWRPLSSFLILTLVGLACVLYRGCELQRRAVSFWVIAFAVSHLTVYCMLYLAVILTGNGDFVYRYFSAEQAAAVCLAGTCFGSIFRRPMLQRAATLIAGVTLLYWTYNASTL